MSSTGTKRSRNRGTASSTTSQISKKNSGKQRDKISKYFTKKRVNDSEDSGSSDLSDSPYKNCVKDVKSAMLDNSASELDDFKTPKAINKVSKLSQSKQVDKNVKKRKKVVQAPLRRFMEDNLKHSDVNPEHLQMALALSESSYEAENPSSQEKRESFKKAFERYGFGYSKTRVSVEMKKEPPRTRKSKYRYITPILKIRTDQEREALISSKVSLILAQNSRKSVGNTDWDVPQLFSERLQKYSNLRIYQLNRRELRELNEEGVFYVRGLAIEACSAPCGCLLKDWRRIAGRDPTPPREIIPPAKMEENSANLLHESVVESATENGDIIVSPELDKHCVITSPSRKMSSPVLSGDDVGVNSSEDKFPPELEGCSSVLSPNRSANCSDQSVVVISPTSGKSPVISPPLEVETVCVDVSGKPSKYRLSPCLELESSPVITSPTHSNTTIILTPPTFKTPRLVMEASPTNVRFNKSPHECLSPDLFESDDDLNSSLNKNLADLSTVPRQGQSLSSVEEMECFDLTQSDDEEKSFHLRLSDPEDSIGQRSDLNVTDYVKNLLQSNSQEESPLPPPSGKIEKISTSEDDSQLSQQSQSSVGLSDDELNYSSVFSSPPKQKYDFDDDEYCNELPLEQRIKSKLSNSPPSSTSQQVDETPTLEDSIIKTSQQVHQTPTLEDSFNGVLSVIQTPNKPGNSNFIIKTTNVTPMANYDEMDTPIIVKELDKFGLKPLKRQKGAKLLRYIYESTHPVVEDENGKVLKKRRTQLQYPQSGGEVIVADLGEEQDLIFERTQSKRVSSCRIPLHIVWHNFVMSNPKIREGILLYEPLQLEVLHSMIKEQGFKFNIQDLLAFLDRKCVTIRTAQGDQHSRRKHKRT